MAKTHSIYIQPFFFTPSIPEDIFLAVLFPPDPRVVTSPWTDPRVVVDPGQAPPRGSGARVKPHPAGRVDPRVDPPRVPSLGGDGSGAFRSMVVMTPIVISGGNDVVVVSNSSRCCRSVGSRSSGGGGGGGGDASHVVVVMG